jgi:hypothetical protein
MMPDKIEGNGIKISIGSNMIKLVLALAVLVAVFMGDTGAIPNF